MGGTLPQSGDSGYDGIPYEMTVHGISSVFRCWSTVCQGFWSLVTVGVRVRILTNSATFIGSAEAREPPPEGGWRNDWLAEARAILVRLTPRCKIDGVG